MGCGVGALGLGLLLLACLGLSLAVQVYRAQADPEGSRAGEGGYAWLVGPAPKALARAAEQRLGAALEVLGDDRVPTADRVARYRDLLARAETLFVRSLRANPGQARALAQLAAIRWEMAPALDEGSTRAYRAMIGVASGLAPRNAAVQRKLGELLFKIGGRDEATALLGRAVGLNPSAAAAVVAFLRENLVPSEEILAALPPVPEALAALRAPFLDEGKGLEYLARVEESLPFESVALVAAYGAACLGLGEARRLLDALQRLPASADSAVEGERLWQRARARTALGDSARALEEARRARDLRPEDPAFHEHLGETALAAGRPDEAVSAFRQSLVLLARRSGGAKRRAFLHVQIARAEEAAGRPDRAYDAYRRAIEIDPGRQEAVRKVEAMESAAGVRKP